MVNIKIEFDELSSLLVTYHILCAPTTLTTKYNQDIFANFTVSPEERGYYLTYLITRGIKLDHIDFAGTKLVVPQYKSLDELICANTSEIPEQVQANLKAFEQNYSPYAENVRQKIEQFKPLRYREFIENIDKIYDTAQRMTGIAIERPREITIRVVDGLAPTSLGSGVKDGQASVTEQSRHFLASDDSYMITLIHEVVGHQTAKASIAHFTTLFGKYIYAIEEGFVKLFTHKIAEKVIGTRAKSLPSGGLEEVAWNTFHKNWEVLDGTNFDQWYKNCLVEINGKVK